jgi:hypothetical protein
MLGLKHWKSRSAAGRRRVYDRLLEMCVPVINKGISYRRELAQKRLKRGQKD